MLSISINGLQIAGSPFRVIVEPDPGMLQTAYFDPGSNQYIIPSPALKVSANPYREDENGSVAKKLTIFSKAVASGPGLDIAHLNVPSEFYVDNCQGMLQYFIFHNSVLLKSVDYCR